MVAPESPTDICNIAMDHLAQPAVADIVTPSSPHEALLARHYDKVRQTCLREYVWTFAKSQTVLSRTGTPLFIYADQYDLPNDFIRFISAGGEFSITDYDIQGPRLLCDNSGAPSLNLTYIRDEENVRVFDPLFVNWFSLRLALEISYKITIKNTVRDSLSKQCGVEEAKASSVYGQERPPRRVQTSKFVRARTNFSTNTGVADKYTRFER